MLFLVVAFAVTALCVHHFKHRSDEHSFRRGQRGPFRHDGWRRGYHVGGEHRANAAAPPALGAVWHQANDTGLATECAECTSKFASERCTISPGDVWAGNYPATLLLSTLSQQPVEFTFGPFNYVLETNALGANWNRIVLTDNFVALQQFAAFPSLIARNCTPSEVAKYSVRWSNNCTQLNIYAIIEPCRERQSLYNNLTLAKLAPTPAASTPPCSFVGGSNLWQAQYSDRVDAFTQAPQVGTFAFAPAGAVVETGESGVYMWRWRAAAVGQVLVTDVAALDPSLEACVVATSGAHPSTTAIAGAYNLTWAADCSSASLAVASDACAPRAARLGGLTLRRVPLATQAAAAAERALSCLAACNAASASALALAACRAKCH